MTKVMSPAPAMRKGTAAARADRVIASGAAQKQRENP
jgi:hypothetical protein